ncbi:MAG: hypothetical protein ACI4EE_03035 [Lachnospiraceae bacterium]
MMDDRKKRLWIAAICYFLGSAGFYIGAIIGFISDGSMATIDLLLGSALLCIGGATLHRINEEQDK